MTASSRLTPSVALPDDGTSRPALESQSSTDVAPPAVGTDRTVEPPVAFLPLVQKSFAACEEQFADSTKKYREQMAEFSGDTCRIVAELDRRLAAADEERTNLRTRESQLRATVARLEQENKKLEVANQPKPDPALAKAQREAADFKKSYLQLRDELNALKRKAAELELEKDEQQQELQEWRMGLRKRGDD